MKVVYSQQARDDLAEIAAYLRPRNAVAAARVGSAIENAVRHIAKFPMLGRLQQDGSRKLVVVPYGFLISYDIDLITIKIAAIRHEARRRGTEDA